MATASPPPSRVVLVVEDEPMQRLMAIDMLEDAGFEVEAVGDADAAVEILARRADIRVVFTDIDMPRGPDGMRLAAMIRDRWPPIEIVLTSGRYSLANLNLPERAVFFPKPYHREKVVAQIAAMMPS